MSINTFATTAAVVAAHVAVGQAAQSPMGSEKLVNSTLKFNATSGSGGCTPGDNSFDILLLVEQWPGSLGMHADGFTIHGLWYVLFFLLKFKFEIQTQI